MDIALFILAIIFFLVVSVGCFLRFYPGIGKTPDTEEQKKYAHRTTYFREGRFQNQRTVKTLTHGKDDKGQRLIPAEEIPVIKTECIPSGEEGKLFVYWLGHSSSLMQFGKKNILIDPVLSGFASPVQFLGPKRFSERSIEPENLPSIDILLLSHDHYDHTDRNTILSIDNKVKKYIVPLGLESCLLGWGIDKGKIETLVWYDKLCIDGIEVSATPSQHFSGRNPLRPAASWWCGYVIQDRFHCVYYTGDGGYSGEFENIGKRFPNIDLALMECGQYGNGWPASHMFPEQTVQAVKDIHAKWCIPIHWGAYCICNNNWDDSILRFTKEADKQEVSYATPLIGERIDFDEIGTYKNNWWESIL